MSKTPKGSGHSAPNEDMKKKFREALDQQARPRWQGRLRRAGGSKVDHAQGAATNATQQMFRRKSGG